MDKALSYQGQVEALAQRLTQGLEAMDFQQRRELLRLLVDEAVYNEGQVTIKTIIPLDSAGSADEVRLYPVPQGGQGDGRPDQSGFSTLAISPHLGNATPEWYNGGMKREGIWLKS